MSNLSRLTPLAWFAAPICALAFLLWVNVARIEQIEAVSALGGWSDHRPPAETTSAALASGSSVRNQLIIPADLTESFHWIAQTQRMLARGEWRVRRIDYENAPFGRAIHDASPYRWWLGLIAWIDHAMSGRPLIQSVERAALFADPLLHAVLLLGTGVMAAWRFGGFPAALISVGCVMSYPLAAAFLPGAPDDHGLSQIFGLGSVLLLLVGVTSKPATPASGRSADRWFFFAGVSGGLGLWLSISAQLPILGGIGAGALLAAWAARRHLEEGSARPGWPWHMWAMGGAMTTLAVFLIEYAPAHLGQWHLSAIHPLYGLAWLGAGEVLTQMTEFIQGKSPHRSFRLLVRLALALSALAATPLAIWKLHGPGFLIPDASALRLTRFSGDPGAENLGAWLARDAAAPLVVATLLPLLLILPAVGLVVRRQTPGDTRVAVALALGPLIIAVGFACQQLAWWSTVGGLLLTMLVAATAPVRGVNDSRVTRLAWSGLGLLLLSPGMLLTVSRARAETKNELTRSEVFALIDRDLGSWLALHTERGQAVVLAPPSDTTALCYYGGIRGIGTLSWENKEGVAAAIRILSAPSAQEAKALIDRRGITHLVLLSWDSTFDEYARLGSGKIEGTFRDELRFQTLPLWLRPVAYPLPIIEGFEGNSVTIFEVVEEQNEATAVSRIAQYFVETGQLDQAESVAHALRRFPADLGALVARAEVELARGDDVAFARSLKQLQARLGARTPPALPWDLRVGLAVLLAKAKQMELSREQVKLCVASADERKLRALSTGALYRLMVLSRAFGLSFDPSVSDLAVELLPADLRVRLN